MADLLNAVPFAVVSAVVTWAGSAWAYTRKRASDHEAQTDRLEIHRDQFTLELLQNARAEMTLVRSELNELREEQHEKQETFRRLEQHAYHFQESLDHLERVLFAESGEALVQAKRDATAFLNRMRRLQDATGAIANEKQRLQSQRDLGLSEGQIP